jgi:alpha-glucosidase
MISAGLLGYAYTCPDMIGGGMQGDFVNIDSDKFDQALIVRSAQIHALMPMMQFSVAPWRILDQKHLEICRNMAHLHVKMGEYILECAKNSAITGEPIVRHMEYMFPDQNFAECKDQFMLGEKYLITPILTSENTRQVVLPKG